MGDRSPRGSPSADEPRESSAPDEPRESSASDKPRESSASDKPRESSASDKPRESSAPDEPRESSAPDEPRESSAPDEPRESSAPDEPRESSAPDEPRESSAPDEPRESSASDKPRESSAPDEPRESSAPDEPRESSASDKPRESSAPDEPPEARQSEKPEETEEPQRDTIERLSAGDYPEKRTSKDAKAKEDEEEKEDKWKCYRIGEKPRRSFWRSEEMLLCQFFFPAEIAFNCLVALGQVPLVMFLDLNDDVGPQERPYSNEVKQLDRSLEILKLLEHEIKKNDIDYLEIEEPDEPVEVPSPGDLMYISEMLERLDNEITAEKKHIEEMEKRHDDLRELKSTREIADKYLEDETDKNPLNEEKDEKAAEEGRGDSDVGGLKVKHIAGTVNREKFPALEQVLYRSCRGKAFAKKEPIKKPFNQNNTEVSKDAFIVFFQGDQLKDRVTKILNGFRANIIETEANIDETKERAANIDDQIKDIETVIDQTKDIYKRLLEALADNFEDWRDKVLKMKATYAALNNFKSKHHLGEGWVAKYDLDEVKKILKDVSAENNGIEPIINVIDPGEEEPPTYFKKDKLIDGFQSLIKAYGIATYRELNPMPYAVVTFPFLFGMMFGDFGHGAILFCCGLAMVVREKQLLKARSRNEIRNIFVAGRYIILFMGIFSMYAGIIYNDVFSRCFNLFGTYWKIDVSLNEAQEASRQKTFVPLDPETDYNRGPYPIGIDPAWHVAHNKIIFLNSYKMKISIIFGVLQMIFGLLLSLWNQIYFHHILDIYSEFLPQILWMICIFVWLCVLIFLKWILFGPQKDFEHSPFCAPSVLVKFINMFLQKGYNAPDGCRSELFPGENLVELILLLIGLCCIPWLLLVKPIGLFIRQSKRKKKSRKERKKRKTRIASEYLSFDEETGEQRRKIRYKKVDETKNAKGEIMIHQGICTIEYILGTISHTASYLRLWALSLAHAQLSEILWNKVMAIPASFTKKIHYAATAVFVIVWLAWAVLTIAILCLMEGLSAFLHTLRLHWVEFQSKFYSGLGYDFEPFNYDKICKAYRDNN